MISYKKIDDYQNGQRSPVSARGMTDTFHSGQGAMFEFSQPLRIGAYGEIEHPTAFFMVSDAHTHIERLVFPVTMLDRAGYDRNEKRTIRTDWSQCEGVRTDEFRGGDIETIEPISAYLDRLARMNEEE